MEIGGWVEPQVELLLSVSLALAEHVGVENVGVSAQISQEFEVYLVVGCSLRRQLHQPRNENSVPELKRKLMNARRVYIYIEDTDKVRRT